MDAPEHEEQRDACCDTCGSLFHAADHRYGRLAEAEFPEGYDPAEADRLIGRDATQR